MVGYFHQDLAYGYERAKGSGKGKGGGGSKSYSEEDDACAKLAEAACQAQVGCAFYLDAANNIPYCYASGCDTAECDAQVE